jgi:fused signal recognition particle receptor
LGYAGHVDKMIEVRYAGVVVGRSAIVRQLDTRGLFLGITEPLPVGTPVVLHISDRAAGEDVPGKVVVVSESQELAHAGMRVQFADPAAASLFGSPEEAPPELEPPPPPPTVVERAPSAAAAETAAAPDAPLAPQPSGHRRIVVDASSEHLPEPAAPEVAGDDESAGYSGAAAGPAPGGTGTESGRIPAPDPSAFSGGARRGRRPRRR